MSQLKRDRIAKRLQRYLSGCIEDQFFDMCWSLNATLHDKHHNAIRYLDYPEGSAGGGIASKTAVRPWELETLICERLLVPPTSIIPDQPNRVMNCRAYKAASTIVSALRALENEEAGLYLRRLNVLLEMHRIAQRQFPVQAGFFNRVAYYRFGYIYGGPQCAEYFERTYGVSMNTFAFAAFALKSRFLKDPGFSGEPDLRFAGIPRDETLLSLKLLSTSIEEARQRQRNDLLKVRMAWGLNPPIAYRPSVLRRYPVITFPPDIFRCPLPELVALRTTAGLYYDLVGGPPALRNEWSKRFEQYCIDLTTALMPRFSVIGEEDYRHRGNPCRTPDVLCMMDDGRVHLAIECKASKLTFDAQYAEDPGVSATRGYDELAAGVVQLWRFHAHSRLGATLHTAHPDARYLLVTLDTWLNMSRELKQDVLTRAHALADDHPDILPSDRRPVVFSSATDYETALLSGDEATLFDALDHAVTESFTGYMLSAVMRDRNNGVDREARDFPFDAATVFPFFDVIETLKEERDAGSS